MQTAILAFGLLCLVVLGMAVGVIFSGRRIKGSCGGLAQMSAQLGGKPGKVSYLPQRPRPASGACKGLMGQPVDAYYYNLTADALQDKRKACESSSAQIKAGTWTNGQ